METSCDALPEVAWDIPDIIWTQDDVWLSGMAYFNGVKVWVNAMPRPVYSDGKINKLAALRDHLEKGVGRAGVDRYGVEYLREHFGVWP